MRVITEDKQYKTTLRPFQKALKRSHFYPLQFRNLSPFDASVWTLFGAYLEFVLQHDKPQWHPLSENIHLAVMADAGQLESRLIELSVVIEGVLGIGFPTIGKPDTELVAQIDSASKLIQESALGQAIKKRFAGSLSTMKSPRAKDRLLVLVNAGIIRHELMNAWHGMRNSAVHAPGLGGAEIELVYEQYQAALTLLNELVMLLIGYRGAYTDYSVRGWPQREWAGTLANIEGNAVSAREPKANKPQPVAEPVDLSALASLQCPASSEPASPVASQIQQTDPK
jgi:hypothetical protein